MKEFIYTKNFLHELERRAINCEKTTLEEFETGLWFFLCSLKWFELVRLANQLNFENNEKKTNIGNHSRPKVFLKPIKNLCIPLFIGVSSIVLKNYLYQKGFYQAVFLLF